MRMSRSDWSVRVVKNSVDLCLQCEGREEERREDSDVDFEASRRSTRVQSKSTIRSALFLAKH